MDERHYRTKLGWEAFSTINLTVIGAGVVGILLKVDTSPHSSVSLYRS